MNVGSLEKDDTISLFSWKKYAGMDPGAVVSKVCIIWGTLFKKKDKTMNIQLDIKNE